MQKRYWVIVLCVVVLAGGFTLWNMQVTDSDLSPTYRVGSNAPISKLIPGADTPAGTELEDVEDQSVTVIPLREPLTLTGTASTNEVFEPNIIVMLDEASHRRLPLEAQEDEAKYMLFPASALAGRALEIGAELNVRFTISDYRLDRRGIETYDSGMLVSFEVLK